MNRKSRLLRLASTVLIAVMMAGSVTMTVMQALDLPVTWLQACVPALIASLACTLVALSGLAAVLVVIGLVAAAAASVAMNLPAWQAVQALVNAFMPLAREGEVVLAGHEATIAAILSAVLASLDYALIFGRVRSETNMAVLLSVCVIIGANALSRTANLALALPALIASAAAYAHASELQQDSGFFRALIPAVLAVAVAFLLVPQQRVTWKPLEDAANRVRSAFEDYFQFTQERIAFSINEAGYDHAGEINGEVVPLLGGPARPDPAEVMRVTTDTGVLLRGSIRRTYTGRSWTDDMEKARYLYYDLTRRSVRDRTFDVGRLSGLAGASAFKSREVAVEMLREGTSTLFVPNRLTDFSMTLETASYFNSVGEVFIARGVEPGDHYSARADLIADRSALAAVLGEAAQRDDTLYQEMLATYTGLPAVIEPGVYDLVQSLTGGMSAPYEKVQAIQYYLQNNYRYTLEVEYPPADRDFVSYFLLDAKQGYCSYFASAMAVMCRIAGIPARYVEGYFAVPDETGTAVLTGEDAHAWVEVYFSGFGWMEFDPTTAARQNGGGDANDPGEDDPDDDGTEATPPPEFPAESPEPTPTPEPTLPPDDPFDDPAPTPTPPPSFFDEPTPPPDTPETPDNNEQNDRDWLRWLLWGLLLLLLLAIAAAMIRARLRVTDPTRLAAREKNNGRAAMILYRSILTLLQQMGHVPLSGETPEAFAERISKSGLENEEFARFAHAVALSRYAGRPVDREMLATGGRAYALFLKKLGRWERIRFTAHRLLRGLGDFEVIP